MLFFFLAFILCHDYFQGCALRKITKNPKVPNYEIQGTQHKAYMKKVSLFGRPKANVSRLRAQSRFFMIDKVASHPYRRLHLPVNARAKNMFSTDVKRICFRCQTLKFSRPNLSLRHLKRLYFRCQTLNFSRSNVKFSRQSQCSRGSLSSQSRNMRKTCENHWCVGKFQSLTPKTSTFEVT